MDPVDHRHSHGFASDSTYKAVSLRGLVLDRNASNHVSFWVNAPLEVIP